MPIYDYITVDEHGVQIHGSMEAADSRDLTRKVWKEGHFLVSCRDRNAPATFSTHTPEKTTTSELTSGVSALHVKIPADPRVSDETWRDRAWNFLHTPAGIAACWIVLGIGVMFDRSFLLRHAPTIWTQMARTDEAAQVGKIKPGVKREWVERILPQRLPGQGSTTKAVYLAEPKVLVTLYYDTTGGAGSPDNKVISYPEIDVMR